MGEEDSNSNAVLEKAEGRERKLWKIHCERGRITTETMLARGMNRSKGKPL